MNLNWIIFWTWRAKFVPLLRCTIIVRIDSGSCLSLQGVAFNRTCAPSCGLVDWKLAGEVTDIRCQQNGTWSKPLMYCVRPNKPPNGVSAELDAFFKMIFTFTQNIITFSPSILGGPHTEIFDVPNKTDRDRQSYLNASMCHFKLQQYSESN
ncbi:hypothetical protein DPMN_071757 [Dreissena polymorpha]|uniref:Sushi domain-containing protein n=1 Tax=Dreissena polymorpha TaxID=45954 RepID=A0A9D3Z3I3_DREPO|nr:hypothetical protein DPMN_071757 [Dreissena polymorpha]